MRLFVLMSSPEVLQGKYCETENQFKYMNDNFLIIMAGGIGSRFWPMSTSETPKQFLDILGTGKTMIQQTVERFDGIVPVENVFIVTSASYKEIIKEQLPGVPISQVLLEPCMRNTAPCIAYAAYKIKLKDPNANIVVAPSDHLITNEKEFQRVINKGLDFVGQNETLLTLGIQPHRPETGYGYIQSSSEDQDGIFSVEGFKEKPNLEKAKEYISAGNFYWNSGIFLWSVSSIVSAFEKHLPEVAKIFAAASDVYNTEKEQAYIDKVYPDCENISIDYGVMERADNIFTLPADFGWSDLGTWGSLWEKRDKDDVGNSVVGSEVKLFDCKNTIVTVPNDRPVVLQGLEDFIVVEANGVFMVCKKEDEQRIKEFSRSVVR